MRKKFAISVYVLLTSILICGCSTLAFIPTVVPPGMDELIEGDTPHLDIGKFKVTTQGIVDARMKYLETMYPAVKSLYGYYRQTSQNIGTTVLGLLSAAGMTGTGMLPWALKKLPKGAVMKQDGEEGG